MKLNIKIAWKFSLSEIVGVKKSVESLGEGIWTSYTGFHRSWRWFIVSAPSEDYREQILQLVKPIEANA